MILFIVIPIVCVVVIGACLLSLGLGRVAQYADEREARLIRAARDGVPVEVRSCKGPGTPRSPCASVDLGGRLTLRPIQPCEVALDIRRSRVRSHQ